MRAGELFENAAGFEKSELSGIFCDSRKITPNGVFVCLEGEKDDGHNYVSEAAAAGAAVIVAKKKVSADIPVIYTDDTAKELARLAEKFYGKPAKKLKLIGVTGTNGKTTVTFLIKAILAAEGKNTGVIGTNRCYINDCQMEFESSMPTTPNGLELAQIFSEMVKKNTEYAVMEVSSHALVQNRVWGLKFSAGVFTNLTRDHLDYHGSMEEYRKAKAKLFEISDIGVINTDSKAGMKIARECSCPVISVGIGEADITAAEICLGDDYVEFTACEREQRHRIHLGIPGKFSVYNALCAIGAARTLGISYKSIKAGLMSAGNVRGRVELVPADTPYRIFIDYAHTPDGLENILKTAKDFTRGRVIAVFGCGGDRDRTKRAPMGEIAGRLADFSVITSDNPRTENPVAIIEDIKKGIDGTGGDYIIVVNRREAIEYALKHAKEHDTVLLCGKGQETYQIIGNRKYDFDERKIVREILTDK